MKDIIIRNPVNINDTLGLTSIRRAWSLGEVSVPTYYWERLPVDSAADKSLEKYSGFRRDSNGAVVGVVHVGDCYYTETLPKGAGFADFFVA